MLAKLVVKHLDTPQEFVMKMTNVSAQKKIIIFSMMLPYGWVNWTFQKLSSAKSTNFSAKLVIYDLSVASTKTK